MTKDERVRAQRLAASVAACVALAAAPAAAQDPPPPMLPAEVPEAPPPPSALPPSALPPSALPPSALPPSTAPFPPPSAAPGEPAVPAEPAAASAEPPALRGSRRTAGARTLNGLVFPTPFLIDSAFITSHVGLGVELGHEWVYGVFTSAFTSATGMLTPGYQYDASIGVTTEYASIGVAINERNEVGLDASYSSLLGSNVNSVLLLGGQSAWTLRPGLRSRLFSSSSSGTQLTLHLYGNFGSSSIQNPQSILQELATEINTVAGNNTGQVACLGTGQLSCTFVSTFNPQTAVRTINTVAGGGGTFSLAQTVGPSFGLQFALGAEFGYGWNDYQGSLVASTPIAFHVGVAPSYDLGPTVPITLMGEYLFTVNVVPSAGTTTQDEMEDDAGTITTIQNALVAGAYYTGRSDLSLGAFFTATFSDSSQSFSDGSAAQGQAPVTVITGQVAARYFF